MGNMKTKNKIILGVLTLFLIGSSFGVGTLTGYSLGKAQCPVCKPEHIDFSLFWEAYNKLQENFVNKEKIDAKNVVYGAIKGMVEALDDPYTVFFTPEDGKIFEDDVKGSFEGIGIEIGMKKNQLQVIAPLEGTPAKKAGLKAGDKIIKVDGKPTTDLTIEEAVRLIRGPKGTKVVLTILRDEWDQSREIEIERAVIKIPSLKLEFLDGNIAYLKLYQFSEKAGFDFRTASLEILSSPAKKIILDLRDNPGGFLEIAQEIAGWFLEKGQIVTIEDFGEGKDKNEFKSQGPSRFLDYKIVVLINKGSASASEILAGALRDNRNIMLIGEKSFGKGSVQTLEKLRDGSSLKITVAKWLTPKGAVLTDNGLEPDITIEITEDDIKKNKDPQLDKAIEIIKAM
jgi:carboxyl-terminal processing protease